MENMGVKANEKAYLIESERHRRNIDPNSNGDNDGQVEVMKVYSLYSRALSPPLKESKPAFSHIPREVRENRRPRLSERLIGARRPSKVGIVNNNNPFHLALNQKGIQTEKTEKDEMIQTVMSSTEVKQKKNKANSTNDTHISPHISLPGVKNALDSKFPVCLRVFWAIVMAFCISFTLYQVSNRLFYYFSYPIVVDVQIFREPHVKLPDVTLCPTQLMNFHYWGQDLQFVDEIRKMFVDPADKKPVVNFTLEELWYNVRLPFKLYFKTLCNSVSQVTNKRRRKQTKRCKLSVKTKDILTIWGTCQTFTFLDKLDYRGIGTSLTIVLDDASHSKLSNSSNILDLKIPNDDDSDESLEEDDDVETGFLYFLHTDEHFSLHQAYLNMRSVPKGSAWGSVIHLKEFHVLNTPDKPCSDPGSVSKCWDKCMHKGIAQDAPCRLPFVPHSKLPKCNWSKAAEAYEATIKSYLTTNLSNCKCPRICNEAMFSVMERPELSKEKNGNTTLRIIFEENNREVVEEMYAYSFSMLLGDIGGNLGLFLGWCILSLLEVLQAFAYHLKQRFDRISEGLNLT